MDKPAIDHQIKTMQAFKNGQKIECSMKSEATSWASVNIPSWNWDAYDYRVKQREVYINFNKEGNPYSVHNSGEECLIANHNGTVVKFIEALD